MACGGHSMCKSSMPDWVMAVGGRTLTTAAPGGLKYLASKESDRGTSTEIVLPEMPVIFRRAVMLLPTRIQVCAFPSRHHVVHLHEFDPGLGHRMFDFDGVAHREAFRTGDGKACSPRRNIGIGDRGCDGLEIRFLSRTIAGRLDRIGFIIGAAIAAHAGGDHDGQMRIANKFDRARLVR